ncbi:YDG domain-containing protein, partial [Flavobacteriaceae bacterium S356]|nr:YDG domain-containing protein [Flavobacteriaceae bacterium S356]
MKKITFLKTLVFLFFTIFSFAQEIGTNDFRISDMGTDGVTSIDGDRAAIAYNSTTGQYLVVWEGDDVDGEQEIYGQLINATTGAEVGSDFRISNMTSTGVTIYRGSAPSVAYNSTTNEFLVVWTGDTNSGGLIDGETEVWGQRISAAGAEVGTDFRISDTNGTGNVLGLSSNAKVTWNATDNEYLVVWSATDPSLGMTYLEFEIFGQRLSSVGAEVGTNDFRISDMGGTGTIDPDAAHPDVVWNSTNNEYMVVWYGSESTANGFEIYAQRLTNAGAETGTNDFVISDMGDATTTYSAFNPEIAYNSTNNEYLVVWQADDNGAPVVDNEVEIFGQRLSNVGAEVGTNDFRISVMGNDAEATATTRDNFRGGQPDVAWNASNNMYMVVWEGEDDSQALDDGEVEIFGRLISNTNTLLGSQLRISNLGGEGNSNFDAGYPRVAVTGTGSALIVFEGENDTGSLADGEEEIWGQGFTVSVSNSAPIEIFPNPPTIESGTTSGTKISDLFVVDADQSNTFTYTLVAGAGSTDNASFAISGTELQANTTFNFATKSTYNLRIQVSDGTTTYQEALVMTVNAPVTTLVGDDFRISNMGPASNTNYDANAPDVAFNSTDDQFLVVWHGDNGTDNKNEIYGEILKGSDGTTVVNQFLISSNVAGNADYDASSVKVAYNSTNNQYLVVWDSDDNTGGMVNDEYEIFGRIVNANGTLSGSQIRISDAGGSGTTTAAASDPDVAYNATNNEYLVVWDADDTDSGVADNLREIYGQRISNVGAEIGTNDFRISNSTLTADSDANDPAVAWNSTNNEYLVVWDADPVNSHNDIIGQRISNVGTEIGADFVIIDAGASTSFDADVAAVVYNATNNQFLVAADADTALDGKNEIYTQLVSNTGTLVGSINKASDHVAGDALYDGTDVALAYLPDAGEYVAVWEGESNDGGQIDNEFEAYLQRITNLNVDTGIDDERVSAVGGTGSNLTRVLAVNAAYSTVSSRLLVVWQADDTNFTVVDNENEIFGQIWKIPSAGDTTAPVFENSTPSSSSVTQSGFTLGTDIDEGGSIYYVVVADGASAPSSAEVKAGTASGGGSAVTSGNAAVSTGGFTNNFSVTGLTAGTAYDVYAVAEDDEGSPNLQASPTKIDVTTTSLIALTITGLTGNNKVYDDNTTASASGTASLSGVLGGDTVNLTGSPTYTFASANVGTGITVNTLGFTISGADAGKYTLTQPTLSADITAATLTVVGLTGDNKIYDGTTAGTATGTATLSGVVGADDVSIGGSPVFTFASANVGTGITLNTSGYTISGTDSGNYTLTQPTISADITAATLTVVGLTGDNKVYDGTTAATATGTATLSGVIGADDVSIGGSPVFTFASANVGTGITINTSGYTISGTDSGNYTLTQPTLSADITAATLTVVGLTGDNKIYDGTTAGTATGTATLSGVVGADDVSIGGSPVFTFASANVGTGITLNTSGYTI